MTSAMTNESANELDVYTSDVPLCLTPGVRPGDIIRYWDQLAVVISTSVAPDFFRIRYFFYIGECQVAGRGPCVIVGHIDNFNPEEWRDL